MTDRAEESVESDDEDTMVVDGSGNLMEKMEEGKKRSHEIKKMMKTMQKMMHKTFWMMMKQQLRNNKIKTMKDKTFAALFTFLLAVLAISLSFLDFCKPRELPVDPFRIDGNEVELYAFGGIR